MRREKESETALSYFYWFSDWLKARQVAFHWVGVSPEASGSQSHSRSLMTMWKQTRAKSQQNKNS